MTSIQSLVRRVLRTNFKLLHTALFTVLVVGAASTIAIGQDQNPSDFVSDPVTPARVDIDLGTIPPEEPIYGEPAVEAPIGSLEETPPLPPAFMYEGGIMGEGDALYSPGGSAPLLEGGAVTPAQFANPNPNFNGSGYTAVVPPDPVGDVGPDHYVQMINSQFQIFDKQGVSLAGPTNINQLWINAGVGNRCRNNNNGDPYVLYDHLADRWIMSQFAVPNGFATPPTAQCIAVSITNDPVTGGWYLYEFTFNFGHDYPKMGVWPDAYYMSSQRGFPGGQLNLVAFDRANMLNGNPATFQAFSSASPALTWLPSDLDGPPPPVGTPAFFTRQVDGNQWGGADRVEIMEFHVDWGVPANSTCGVGGGAGTCGAPNASLAAAGFDSNMCATGSLLDNCVPQPGTATLLETLPHWPMGPAQFRDFATYSAMVFNHTVDVDGTGHAGIRWYELRRTGGVWSIFQQGTHSPDAGNPGLADDEHRWMGSMAMDKDGNIALGYSVSSSTVFPGIAYAGRFAGDPLGLLPQGAPPNGEFTLVAGGNSQIINGSRWGDYSAMRVDPIDGCTFWYTTEFIAAGNVFGPGNGGAWATQIGAFSFPSCSGSDLEIAKSDGPDPVIAGETLTYTITVTNNGGQTATNVTVLDVPPVGTTFLTSTVPCASTSPPVGERTCNLGAIAAGDSRTFQIQVLVGSAAVVGSGGATTITNTASVFADQVDPNTSNNTATAATIVNDRADLRVIKQCKPDGAVAAGDTATCTIFVDNLGSSDARGVVVTDTHLSNGSFTINSAAFGSPPTNPCGIASGVVTCNLGTEPAGGRTTIVVSITSNDQVDVNDTASVTSDTPDPNGSNNADEASVSFVGRADLDVVKIDTPDPVVAGNNVTYTLTVTNSGPSTAVNAVLRDNVPAGVSIVSVSVAAPGGSCLAGEPGNAAKPTVCALGNLISGASRTITVVTTVLPQTLGQLNNDATVSSDTVDPDNADNHDSEPTTVQAQADLVVQKSDSPDPVNAGASLTYTVRVANNGSSTARGVAIVDTLPPQVDFVSASFVVGTGSCVAAAGTPTVVTCSVNDLDPGAFAEVVMLVRVRASVPDGTSIAQTARVSASTPDPDTGNNGVTIQTLVLTQAELWIDKTGVQVTGNPSRTIRYTLTVNNKAGCESDDVLSCGGGGPSDAQGIVVVDSLPLDPKKVKVVFVSQNCSYSPSTHKVTCTQATLPAGASVAFRIDIQIAGSVGEFTNTAAVTSSTADPIVANNTDLLKMVVKGGTARPSK